MIIDRKIEYCLNIGNTTSLFSYNKISVFFFRKYHLSLTGKNFFDKINMTKEQKSCHTRA